ncbi:MAG: hypothetical protein CMK09_02575 [Ponticaulis sp.]|nr:hypothetical protein [Ponticaulis sp.]|tara:strand:- start:35985 stop:37001 length:1017 start_codon:yes stop_codon:yes gene_type:complete
MLKTSQYADWLIQEINSLSDQSSISNCEKTAANRILITIKAGKHSLRFRILLFAVGKAYRTNPHERRVEITSTYEGNLEPLGGSADVVLGVEREKRLLVGIDPRRLHHGGSTHNASTFVYRPSFAKISTTGWFSHEVKTQLFDQEYQLYFKPDFLINYLLQQDTLHSTGLFIGKSAKIHDQDIDSIDHYLATGSNTELSYDQQVLLALKKMQIGRAGEELVFRREKKKLKKLGLKKYAQMVEWTSQKTPFVGYDISSFNQKGKLELIEVKTSVNKLNKFYFTANEYKTASKYNDKYSIVCVSNVFEVPKFRILRNPIAQIASGELQLSEETSVVRIMS